jgi:hypothetical protein
LFPATQKGFAPRVLPLNHLPREVQTALAFCHTSSCAVANPSMNCRSSVVLVLVVLVLL